MYYYLKPRLLWWLGSVHLSNPRRWGPYRSLFVCKTEQWWVAAPLLVSPLAGGGVLRQERRPPYLVGMGGGWAASVRVAT